MIPVPTEFSGRIIAALPTLLLTSGSEGTSTHKCSSWVLRRKEWDRFFGASSKRRIQLLIFQASPSSAIYSLPPRGWQSTLGWEFKQVQMLTGWELRLEKLVGFSSSLPVTCTVKKKAKCIIWVKAHRQCCCLSCRAAADCPQHMLLTGAQISSAPRDLSH